MSTALGSSHSLLYRKPVMPRAFQLPFPFHEPLLGAFVEAPDGYGFTLRFQEAPTAEARARIAKEYEASVYGSTVDSGGPTDEPWRWADHLVVVIFPAADQVPEFTEP